MTMITVMVAVVLVTMWTKNNDYNDDDDNLGGDAAIIRDNGFNQGHLLQDHKQEALHYRDNHRNSLLFFKIFNNALGKPSFVKKKIFCEITS